LLGGFLTACSDLFTRIGQGTAPGNSFQVATLCRKFGRASGIDNKFAAPRQVAVLGKRPKLVFAPRAESATHPTSRRPIQGKSAVARISARILKSLDLAQGLDRDGF
jgi:hypothetical protein